MEFAAALLGYSIQFVFLAAAAGIGIFIGKTVRDHKKARNNNQ